MINLLSVTDKKSLRAAHLNVLLRRYIVLLCGVAICIVLIFGFGFWLQINEQARYIEASQKFAAERAQYTKAQQTGKAFADNLTIAKTILSNEVLFSDLTTTIARTLPPGASLQTLTVSTADFAKPISLVIQTNSYDNAVKTKDSFENSAAFEGVNILSASQIKDSKTKYNYTVTLSVTVTKDAFIHGKAQ